MSHAQNNVHKLPSDPADPAGGMSFEELRIEPVDDTARRVAHEAETTDLRNVIGRDAVYAALRSKQES